MLDLGYFTDLAGRDWLHARRLPGVIDAGQVAE